MAIELKCKCGTAFSVPDQFSGKKGRCPNCGNIINVPEDGLEDLSQYAADDEPESDDLLDAPAKEEPAKKPASRPRPKTRDRKPIGNVPTRSRAKTGARAPAPSRSRGGGGRRGYRDRDDEEDDDPYYGRSKKSSSTPIIIGVIIGVAVLAIVIMIVVASNKTTAHDPVLYSRVSDFLQLYTSGETDRAVSFAQSGTTAQGLSDMMGGPAGGGYTYDTMRLSEGGGTAYVYVITPSGSKLNLIWKNTGDTWVLTGSR